MADTSGAGFQNFSNNSQFSPNVGQPPTSPQQQELIRVDSGFIFIGNRKFKASYKPGGTSITSQDELKRIVDTLVKPKIQQQGQEKFVQLLNEVHQHAAQRQMQGLGATIEVTKDKIQIHHQVLEIKEPLSTESGSSSEQVNQGLLDLTKRCTMVFDKSIISASTETSPTTSTVTTSTSANTQSTNTSGAESTLAAKQIEQSVKAQAPSKKDLEVAKLQKEVTSLQNELKNALSAFSAHEIKHAIDSVFDEGHMNLLEGGGQSAEERTLADILHEESNIALYNALQSFKPETEKIKKSSLFTKFKSENRQKEANRALRNFLLNQISRMPRVLSTKEGVQIQTFIRGNQNDPLSRLKNIQSSKEELSQVFIEEEFDDSHSETASHVKKTNKEFSSLGEKNRGYPSISDTVSKFHTQDNDIHVANLGVVEQVKNDNTSSIAVMRSAKTETLAKMAEAMMFACDSQLKTTHPQGIRPILDENGKQQFEDDLPTYEFQHMITTHLDMSSVKTFLSQVKGLFSKETAADESAYVMQILNVIDEWPTEGYKYETKIGDESVIIVLKKPRISNQILTETVRGIATPKITGATNRAVEFGQQASDRINFIANQHLFDEFLDGFLKNTARLPEQHFNVFNDTYKKYIATSDALASRLAQKYGITKDTILNNGRIVFDQLSLVKIVNDKDLFSSKEFLEYQNAVAEMLLTDMVQQNPSPTSELLFRVLFRREVPRSKEKIGKELLSRVKNGNFTLAPPLSEEIHVADLELYRNLVCKRLNFSFGKQCKSGTDRTAISVSLAAAQQRFENEYGREFDPSSQDQLDRLRFKKLFRESIQEFGLAITTETKGYSGLKWVGGVHGNPVAYKYLFNEDDFKNPESLKRIGLSLKQPDVVGVTNRDYDARGLDQYKGQLRNELDYYGKAKKSNIKETTQVKDEFFEERVGSLQEAQKALNTFLSADLALKENIIDEGLHLRQHIKDFMLLESPQNSTRTRLELIKAKINELTSNEEKSQSHKQELMLYVLNDILHKHAVLSKAKENIKTQEECEKSRDVSEPSLIKASRPLNHCVETITHLLMKGNKQEIENYLKSLSDDEQWALFSAAPQITIRAQGEQTKLLDGIREIIQSSLEANNNIDNQKRKEVENLISNDSNLIELMESHSESSIAKSLPAVLDDLSSTDYFYRYNKINKKIALESTLQTTLTQIWLEKANAQLIATLKSKDGLEIQQLLILYPNKAIIAPKDLFKLISVELNNNINNDEVRILIQFCIDWINENKETKFFDTETINQIKDTLNIAGNKLSGQKLAGLDDALATLSQKNVPPKCDPEILLNKMSKIGNREEINTLMAAVQMGKWTKKDENQIAQDISNAFIQIYSKAQAKDYIPSKFSTTEIGGSFTGQALTIVGNRLSGYVEYQILNSQSLEERANVTMFFLNIADKLRERGCLDGANALYVGISQAKSMEKGNIEKEYRNKYNELNQLFSPGISSTFAPLREYSKELASKGVFYIPYTPLVKDVTNKEAAIQQKFELVSGNIQYNTGALHTLDNEVLKLVGNSYYYRASIEQNNEPFQLRTTLFDDAMLRQPLDDIQKEQLLKNPLSVLEFNKDTPIDQVIISASQFAASIKYLNELIKDNVDNAGAIFFIAKERYNAFQAVYDSLNEEYQKHLKTPQIEDFEAEKIRKESKLNFLIEHLKEMRAVLDQPDTVKSAFSLTSSKKSLEADLISSLKDREINGPRSDKARLLEKFTEVEQQADKMRYVDTEFPRRLANILNHEIALSLFGTPAARVEARAKVTLLLSYWTQSPRMKEVIESLPILKSMILEFIKHSSPASPKLAQMQVEVKQELAKITQMSSVDDKLNVYKKISNTISSFANSASNALVWNEKIGNSTYQSHWGQEFITEIIEQETNHMYNEIKSVLANDKDFASALKSINENGGKLTKLNAQSQKILGSSNLDEVKGFYNDAFKLLKAYSEPMHTVLEKFPPLFRENAFFEYFREKKGVKSFNEYGSFEAVKKIVSRDIDSDKFNSLFSKDEINTMKDFLSSVEIGGVSGTKNIELTGNTPSNLRNRLQNVSNNLSHVQTADKENAAKNVTTLFQARKDIAEIEKQLNSLPPLERSDLENKAREIEMVIADSIDNLKVSKKTTEAEKELDTLFDKMKKYRNRYVTTKDNDEQRTEASQKLNEVSGQIATLFKDEQNVPLIANMLSTTLMKSLYSMPESSDKEYKEKAFYMLKYAMSSSLSDSILKAHPHLGGVIAEFTAAIFPEHTKTLKEIIDIQHKVQYNKGLSLEELKTLAIRTTLQLKGEVSTELGKITKFPGENGTINDEYEISSNWANSFLTSWIDSLEDAIKQPYFAEILKNDEFLHYVQQATDCAARLATTPKENYEEIGNLIRVIDTCITKLERFSPIIKFSGAYLKLLNPLLVTVRSQRNESFNTILDSKSVKDAVKDVIGAKSTAINQLYKLLEEPENLAKTIITQSTDGLKNFAECISSIPDIVRRKVVEEQLGMQELTRLVKTLKQDPYFEKADTKDAVIELVRSIRNDKGLSVSASDVLDCVLQHALFSMTRVSGKYFNEGYNPANEPVTDEIAAANLCIREGKRLEALFQAFGKTVSDDDIQKYSTIAKSFTHVRNALLIRPEKRDTHVLESKLKSQCGELIPNILDRLQDIQKPQGGKKLVYDALNTYKGIVGEESCNKLTNHYKNLERILTNSVTALQNSLTEEQKEKLSKLDALSPVDRLNAYNAAFSSFDSLDFPKFFGEIFSIQEELFKELEALNQDFASAKDILLNKVNTEWAKANNKLGKDFEGKPDAFKLSYLKSQDIQLFNELDKAMKDLTDFTQTVTFIPSKINERLDMFSKAYLQYIPYEKNALREQALKVFSQVQSSMEKM